MASLASCERPVESSAGALQQRVECPHRLLAGLSPGLLGSYA